MSANEGNIVPCHAQAAANTLHSLVIIQVIGYRKIDARHSGFWMQIMEKYLPMKQIVQKDGTILINSVY